MQAITKQRIFKSKQLAISIVIPTFNEEGNIEPLVNRIHSSFLINNLNYELIFIDDHSTDDTALKISQLQKFYPIKFVLKKGQTGKAQSILEGASYAKCDLIAMIDADLQYPPEKIPEMIKKIDQGADIVIANRTQQHTTLLRKIIHYGFMLVFGKLLHGFDFDVQSGLKVFKKEILERVTLNPTPWTFDLEFLIKATHAQYQISTVDIIFEKRFSGSSKLPILKSIFEIGIGAIKMKFQTPQVILFTDKMIKKSGIGFHFKGERYITYNSLPMKDSAVFTLTYNQILLISLTFLFLVFSIFFNWHATIITVLAIITALYFTDILFNFYLICKSFTTNPEIFVSSQNIQKISNWPVYTILCPLYKEWQVLPQFIKGISNFNYPKNKLQVLLLLEEDDKTTIKHVQQIKLPKFFKILIVPHSIPKTKPKACNYGLRFAKGEFTPHSRWNPTTC